VNCVEFLVYVHVFYLLQFVELFQEIDPTNSKIGRRKVKTKQNNNNNNNNNNILFFFLSLHHQ